MSVVNITVDRRSWSGSASAAGREYSIDYLVQFSTAGEGCAAAIAALGLRIGQAYRVENDGDASAVLKSLSPKCEDKAKLFRVTAKWGPRDREQEIPNPLDRPVVWTYGAQTERIAVWKTHDGKAIVNSALQYFDPPVEDDIHFPHITAVRNVAIFDDARADKFTGKLNKDRWKNRKAGTVKCLAISGDGPHYENGFEFFTERLEFAVKPEGWDLELLDQGRNARIDGNLVPIKAKDTSGNELPDYVSDPVPLEKQANGDARELSDPTPETVTYLKFATKTRLNFQELGL